MLERGGIDRACGYLLRWAMLAIGPTVLLSFVATASAARIEGSVKTRAAGTGIENATVLLCSASSPLCNPAEAQTTSTWAGRYSFETPAGEYRVYAYAPGYQGRFYGTAPWSTAPVSTPSPAKIAVGSQDKTLDPIELTASTSTDRFCAEPRLDPPRLTSVEARKPGEAGFKPVAIEGSDGQQLACQIADGADRQKVELLLPSGQPDLASAYPAGTAVRLKFSAPEQLQPHFMLAVAELGGGLSFSSNGYVVDLDTTQQLSGTFGSILSSRLSFTVIRRPDDLTKLGADAFKGMTIATNGDFAGDPFADDASPAFSQQLAIPGGTLIAPDKGWAQAQIPQDLLEWWQAPYSEYQAAINDSQRSENSVTASEVANGALLRVNFTFRKQTKLTWSVPEQYLQKRPVVKQSVPKPNCVALPSEGAPWYWLDLDGKVNIPIYCRSGSTAQAWLLSPNNRQLGYIGQRRTSDGLDVYGWPFPASLRSGDYRIKVRSVRHQKKIDEMYVSVRHGIPGAAKVPTTGKVYHASNGAGILKGTSKNDRIFGYGGDNHLYGRRGSDLLEGGSGADLLLGGAGLDTLRGGPGANILNGNSGNDAIYGGPDVDTVAGGTGNDLISTAAGDDMVRPGDGDDSVSTGHGNDRIYERFGNDRLEGGEGDDYIDAARGSDSVAGGPGFDQINGGPGRDILSSDEDDDIVQGELGPDVITGGDGNDTINGGSGPDYIDAGAGDDNIIGGGDVDTIVAGPGNDFVDSADHLAEDIDCGDGQDRVRMYRYKAPLPGAYLDEDRLKDCEIVDVVPYAQAPGSDSPSQAGNVVKGTKGSDLLEGTADPDTILGRAGPDSIFGLAGNDVLEGEGGNDRVRGGPGDDIVSGRSGDDTLWGNEGNDRIDGNRGQDRIYGNDGDDKLRGGFDTDVIQGGPGNDRIVTVGPKSEIDRVACGPGYDIVHIDSRDRAARSCEKVVRR